MKSRLLNYLTAKHLTVIVFLSIFIIATLITLIVLVPYLKIDVAVEHPTHNDTLPSIEIDPETMGAMENNVEQPESLEGFQSAPGDMVHKIKDIAYCDGTFLSEDPTFRRTNCSDLGSNFQKLYCSNSFVDSDVLYFFNENTYQNPAACQNYTSIDLATFRNLDGLYYSDENDVYAHINYIETNEILALGADPQSFEPLSFGFARDRNNLYYPVNGTWSIASEIVIGGASPQTFEALSGGYAKDNNQVYYLQQPTHEGFARLKILPVADPSSFAFVGMSSHASLAKDRDHVFYNGNIVDAADPNTLRIFEFSVQIFADAQTIFLNGVSQPEIDAETFSIRSSGQFSAQASDKNNHFVIKVTGNDGQLLAIEVVR